MSDEQQRDRAADADDRAAEVRRLVRILTGIARTAREASLTGQLAGGRAVAVRQYNAVFARVEALGLLSPPDLFQRLPEDAGFDEAGVAASQLAAYLREDCEEGPRRRWRTAGGVVECGPGHMKIVGFPEGLSELGEVLREYLPDFLRERPRAGRHDQHDRPPGPRSEGSAPPPPEPPPGFQSEDVGRIAREMHRIAERMARGDLSADQLRTLAHELDRLATLQSELLDEGKHEGR